MGVGVTVGEGVSEGVAGTGVNVARRVAVGLGVSVRVGRTIATDVGVGVGGRMIRPQPPAVTLIMIASTSLFTHRLLDLFNDSHSRACKATTDSILAEVTRKVKQCSSCL
jgi:hypothetical protein